MDFGLAEHRRLAAEALDDRAHERPRADRGDEDRHPAETRRVLVAVADQVHELAQLRGLHGEVAVVAMADDRLEKSLLPLRREGDDRHVAGWRGVLRADLTGEARAHVLGDVTRV